MFVLKRRMNYYHARSCDLTSRIHTNKPSIIVAQYFFYESNGLLFNYAYCDCVFCPKKVD